MNELSSVYWIHLPEHTDITSEGYIGITTKDFKVRYAQHIGVSKTSSRTILSKAIRKYKDNLIVEVLLKGSEEYCLMIEEKLRPTDRLGWNTVKGGGKPPVFTKGHTEESKKKIGEASKLIGKNPNFIASVEAKRGVPRTKEVIAKMRASMQGRLPWETAMSDKEVWAIADVIFSAHINNPSFGYIKLGQMFSFPKKYMLQNIYLKFTKQNWNPNTDPAWLKWVQTYKLNKGN